MPSAESFNFIQREKKMYEIKKSHTTAQSVHSIFFLKTKKENNKTNDF